MNSFPLNAVVRFEVRRTIRRPQFWVAALLIPAVMGGVALVASWAGATTPVNTETNEISFQYSDGSGVISSDVADHLGGSPATGDAESLVRSGDLDAYLVFPTEPATTPVRIVAADRGVFNNGVYSSIAKTLFKNSIDEQLGSTALVSLVRTSLSITLEPLDGDQPADGLGAMFAPAFLAGLFLVVVSLLGNQMLNTTVEEKENRISEMLLVSLPARTLIRGKLAALALLGAIQIGVVIATSVVLLLFASRNLDLKQLGVGDLVFDPVRLSVGFVLLVSALVMTTSLLVLTGAAMPSAKDAAPFFSAMVLINVAPIYLISTVLFNPHSPVVAVMTYFPLSAPITALIRNAAGSLDPWLGMLVAAELLLVGALIMRLAVTVFQRGVIQYDRRIPIREMFAPRP